MISSKHHSKYYTWGDNCDCWILNDSDHLSVKQERMPSGTTEKLHFHKYAEQFFYILKGEAVFWINDEKLIVKASESISISPMSKHYISNESGEDLEFLVVSNPSTNNDRTEV